MGKNGQKWAKISVLLVVRLLLESGYYFEEVPIECGYYKRAATNEARLQL